MHAVHLPEILHCQSGALIQTSAERVPDLCNMHVDAVYKPKDGGNDYSSHTYHYQLFVSRCLEACVQFWDVDYSLAGVQSSL